MALEIVVDTLDVVPETLRSLYAEKDGKFHLDVAGLPDNSGLMSALEKERAAAKAAEKARKELEARYKDVDPDKYRQIMSKFDGDEEAQLLAAGKVDEVIAKRTAKRDAEWQRKLDEAMNASNAEKAKAEKFLGRVLDDQIRAAVNGKVHEKAVEDALFRGRMMFSLNDDGVAVQKDKDGSVVIGKDGKTPFMPSEWIESMRESAPHWFPATGTGTGARQAASSGGAKTISRAQYEVLTPAEQKAAINSGIKVVDK